MGSCPSKLFVFDAKTKQNNEVNAWRASHSSSVRSSMIARKKSDIEVDYFLHRDQVLGKGAHGVVVTGEKKSTQKEKIYAIKICDKNLCDRARLEREILLMKDVDHCNIVRLYEVYCTPTHTHFVTELCSGGHLGNLLSKQSSGGVAKRIGEEDAKSLCRQLLSAVRHLHERGIAHRDIKLQNILIDRRVPLEVAQGKKRLSEAINLKIIDFGYGSRYVGCCPMKTVCGTMYTTAPEVLRESYDERCDVWSVGVVLFIMLSGKRPFESLNIRGSLTEAGKAAMTTNILAGRYSFATDNWNGVSPDAKAFVKALLHSNYQHRVHAKEAMVLPWMRDLTSTSMRMNSEKILTLSREVNFVSPHCSVKVCPIDSDDATSMAVSDTADGQAANPNSGLNLTSDSEVVSNILKNNQNLSAQSDMRRCGNMALAFGLQENEATNIRELFQTLDLDGSGALSRPEFAEAMLILCPTLSESDCTLVFDTMDINRDDQITFTEFLAATLNPQAVDISELNDAFALLDSNNDGYISLDEIHKIYSYKHMKKKRPTASSNTIRKMGSDKNELLEPSNKQPSLYQLKSDPTFDLISENTGPGTGTDSVAAATISEDADLPKIFTSTLMARSQEMSLEEQIESMISACDIDHDGKISHEEFIFAMTGAMDFFNGDKHQASQVLSASASQSKLRRERVAPDHAGKEEMKSAGDATSEKGKGGETENVVCVDDGATNNNNATDLEEHFSEEGRKLSLTPLALALSTGADISGCISEVVEPVKPGE